MNHIPALIAATLVTFVACAEPAQPPADPQRMASQLAVDTLASELGIPREQVVVETVDAVEWRDSSLGCPEPGKLYLSVITPGYRVALRVGGQLHVVHEADDRAVVCRHVEGLDGAASTGALSEGPQMAVARTDLANRLGVRPEDIEFVSRESKTWNDSSLGCPEPGMQYMQVIVEGSVLTFRHGERIYTYHADDNQAIPCPPIPAK